MQAIAHFLKQHQKAIFGITTSLLASYLLFRSNLWNKTSSRKTANLLEVTLPNLIANKSHVRIKKIVITTSSSSRGDFRKVLINFLKSRLTEENIKVLINCSPQKLLKAGCECFLESMQSDDGEYLQYYYNALKAQFLIEDTISNIELINQNNPNQIVMICDNNPFDIKLLNRSDHLWAQFLQKYEINEEKILEGYDLVIHVIDKDSLKDEDDRIREVWSRIPQYHQILVQKNNSKQNTQIALTKILQFLSQRQDDAILIS